MYIYTYILAQYYALHDQVMIHACGQQRMSLALSCYAPSFISIHCLRT